MLLNWKISEPSQEKRTKQFVIKVLLKSKLLKLMYIFLSIFMCEILYSCEWYRSPHFCTEPLICVQESKESDIFSSVGESVLIISDSYMDVRAM